MDKTSKLKLGLPSEADPIAPEDFNANFRALEAYVTSIAQICSATSPGALSLSTGWKTVSFGAMVKSGYAFALSGGGVKVGEPGFAKVDVHVHVTGLDPGDAVEVDVAKNGATFWQYTSIDAAGGYVTVDQASRIFPVAKNDIVSVKLHNGVASRGTLNREATHMTVQLFKDLNF